jgi:hypothetical protein
LIAVVVLPTPPFWLVIAMIMSGLQSMKKRLPGQAAAPPMSARRHRR